MKKNKSLSLWEKEVKGNQTIKKNLGEGRMTHRKAGRTEKEYCELSSKK